MVFPNFLDYSPSIPPLCKKESQMMVIKCQDSSSGITRSLHLVTGCGGGWSGLLQVWNGPHLYDVSLLGHKLGAKALFGCKSLGCVLVFGGDWGCNSGSCLFSYRTESQHVLVVHLKPDRVSRLCTEQESSTESIQVLFEMEFICMPRPGNF